jgi:hypothetical protein
MSPPLWGLRFGSVVLILIGRRIKVMTIIVNFLMMIVIIVHISTMLLNKQKLEIVSAHTIKKYVHWQLPIFVLVAECRYTEIAILRSWWGQFPWHWKIKLFVVRLSSFWLRKILLDHPKKKLFLAKTKQMKGTNGPDPLTTCIKHLKLNWEFQCPIDIWFIKSHWNLQNKGENVFFERATPNNISWDFMSLYGDNCSAVLDIFPESYNTE